MSAFTIGGDQYYSSGPEDLDELGMEAPLSDLLLGPGKVFSYDYDFGSTTELKLKLVRMRECIADLDGIDLLARNDAPHFTCDSCGNQAATQICTACDPVGKGRLCEACAEVHDCDPELFLPVVNSPRAGVCVCSG